MAAVRSVVQGPIAISGCGQLGSAQAAVYDMEYSFYVTNTYPGGGPTVCTGQCLIDFAERIGIEPPDDLYGEFHVEANGVSRFYERNGWVDPVGFESYYPSRGGSTQVGNADWGKIEIYTYVSGGNCVSCDLLQMELGCLANTCPSLSYPTVPTLREPAAAGTNAPIEIPIELGDGMLGTDGYAAFKNVPELRSFGLLGRGLVGLRASQRRPDRVARTWHRQPRLPLDSSGHSE